MSLHLIKSDALLLHIPKTGGTWVEDVLRHCNIEVVRTESVDSVTPRHPLNCQYIGKYTYSFSFVRHPIGWYESWWKYQSGSWPSHDPGKWHPQRVLEKCNSDDFSTFIRNCIKHEPAYVTRMYEWYVGPEGYNFVSHIALYENLKEELIKILSYLSYEFDPDAIRNFGPTNVSSKLCGEPVWDLELKTTILSLEGPTIRRFYGG